MTPIDPFGDLLTRWRTSTIGAEEFVHDFARELTAAMHCTRAGVWVFVEDDSTDRTEVVLHCLALYDAPSGQFQQPTDMRSSDVRAYFHALMRDGHVMAPDARRDAVTVDFLDEYLLPHDVHSLLDAAFAVNNELLGIVSCEQSGAPLAWTARHLQRLKIIGSRMAVALREASAVAGIPYSPRVAPGTR